MRNFHKEYPYANMQYKTLKRRISPQELHL